MTSAVTTATLDAYERWAPSYPPVPHNPLMRAEQEGMLRHWPDVRGKRALDLACGSGRYSKLLRQSQAAHVVALDFCQPMLSRVADVPRVRANMMRLPFADDSFDVVVSGLAIGHADSLEAWMCEAARVLDEGGCLLYSDFHAAAVGAGLTRSFKDAADRTWTVPHSTHDLDAQLRAAVAAGLTVEAVHEIRVGIELTEPFPRSDDFYARCSGVPIVLVVRARK
jgi:malonyl-CoA O-methyltransferase